MSPKIPYDVRDQVFAPRSLPVRRKPRGAPPKLSDRALHGMAGDVVDQIAPYTEASKAALLVDFLTSFGSAVGPGAYIRADSAKHQLKLFAVVVGATSSARKGTSRATMRRLFRLVAPTWAEEHVTSGLSSGEGLIAALGDEEQRQLTRRLLIEETEFGRVLTVATRTGNTLPDYMRQLWDGDRVNILTKRRVSLNGAFVSIIGHITAEELALKLNDVDIANGFANRFLWVYAERAQYIPSGEGFPDGRQEALAEDVREVLELAKGIGRMRRDQDAEDLWAERYVETAEHELPGLLGAATSRAPAQMLRLSMLYAALDGSAVIRPVHVEAAHALWKYCEGSAAYVLGRYTTGNPLADKILKALEESPEGRLSRTEISSGLFKNNVKSHEIRAAVDLLRERDRVHVETGAPTRGRPARFVVLNREEEAGA
jgi:hypothetical protein